MGLKEETEYESAMSAYEAEAIKNVVAAFNEGYLMGKHHAELLFGEEEHADKS